MLLCNAGLAIENENQILLVDALNANEPPFAEISHTLWDQILNRTPPFDCVCGLYFTHNHPDHCDEKKILEYTARWPEIPVWRPDDAPDCGEVMMGCFTAVYRKISHAPMDAPLPEHVVSLIRSGEKEIYIAADAALDVEPHRSFLQGRKMDAAFWNSMYLSRKETRELLAQTSARNYIYHMPPLDPDGFGIWKKCKKNLQRYPDELCSVRVIKRYPTMIDI